ncbi:MAG: THUMP domain-containing protein [Thermoproteales archaeon]|nr:THUMP domain-containing protein [Thermoproteales archaeon]
MLDEFNLVASTYRGRENELLSELWYFLRDLGDSRARASTTGLPGLTVLYTKLDPLRVVEEARERVRREPWYFRYLLKLVPIEVCIPAELEAIRRAALELAAKKLREGETYKVEVRKRLTTLSRRELIEAIASGISNKVNLEAPDKIVLVEIIGRVAGVSVIEPKYILSVQKLRRESAGEVL